MSSNHPQLVSASTPQAKHPLDSPDLRFLLNTALPAATALVAVCYDFLSRVSYPSSVESVFKALVSPLRSFYTLDDLRSSEPVECPLPKAPWKPRVLVLLAVLESVVSLVILTLAESAGHWALSLEAGVGFLTWTYTFIRVLARPPVTPPYLLIAFYTTYAISALAQLTNQLLSDPTAYGIVALDVFQLSVPSVLILVAGTYPLESIWPATNVALGSQYPPSTQYTMPEDSVNLWSWSTFSFVEPMFDIASLRTINENDVWQLSPYLAHKNIFEKYLQYIAQHPTHSLIRYLIASNSLDLVVDVVLESWGVIVGFVLPYALQRILTGLSDPTPNAKNTAYLFAVVTFLANLSFAQKELNQLWFTRRCYERTRGQLLCVLHYKALMRRHVSGNKTQTDGTDGVADLGKITNLMRGDAYTIAQRFWDFSGFFLAPVRLAIAMVFLYNVLGWSALAAIAVVIIAFVLNWPLAKCELHATRASCKARDRRTTMVNELFQNIRFLKFYGWEFRWSEGGVRDARETELQWRVKSNVINVATYFLWTWIPSATALTTFLCYTVLAGERLTVAKAFTAISLFSHVQGPMTQLPSQFSSILHAYISMQRIEAFLKETEVPDWASSLKRSMDHVASAREETIGFQDASFEWEVTQDNVPPRVILRKLSVKFPVGKVSLVSGPTSAGKSALLVALLGEINCVSGQVHLNKSNYRVAYCAQNPWLENATIRDNILFASAYGYDEQRYKAVIDACALVTDLENLRAGDSTEIGEKGITLSGGQRARIALARALYSPAQVILLDDPLAAVDHNTAQHIVKRALSGPLAHGRTIILVTHHIDICRPIADYMVELSSGTIVRQGFTRELQDRGGLAHLVETEDIDEEDKPASTPPTIDNEDISVNRTRNQRQSRDGKLVNEEARAEGRVSFKTYWTYIRAAGIVSSLITFALMILIQLITIADQVFLAKWGDAYEAANASHTVYQVVAPRGFFDNLPPPDVDVKPWLVIFLWISVTGAAVTLSYISLGYYSSLQAARSLFVAMLRRLSRAPARFFDTTPIGRILNRFTSDIDMLDNALLPSARAALSSTFDFVLSFSVIVFVVPSFAPFALGIAWLYVRIAPPYVRASRDLRRLEAVSLSPAFSGFDELLQGLPHVRAFGMEQRYQDQFYKRMDKFQSFDHVYWLVAGWLNWRYDCLGSAVVFLTTMFALWSDVSSGYAALVIVQAATFSDASRLLVRALAHVDLNFNSVERIVEYLEVPQEAPAVISENRPPAWWPSSSGVLVVEDLVVKYASHLPAALRGLNFQVNPAEKIGVVGRTGSGKSTLAMSFLRIIEPSGGRIVIDGIDITTIGLEDLRNRITIISQDVSLFAGTLRSNLDPFGEHTDQECWDALRCCHLTSAMSLDTLIGPSGSISAGERQLVAMARAILRRSRVIVMDEATSHIDTVLDDQIQRTIREEFADAIVITIAHRLRTVLDYDRIAVLVAGEIVEFDTPSVLLARYGGVFRGMCALSMDSHVQAAIT